MGFLGTISGKQAAQDMKEAKLMRQQAEKKLEEYKKRREEQAEMANSRLESVGKAKLQVVQDTIVPFMGYIELLKQKTKGSEFETLSSVSISQEEFVKMKEIGVTAGSILSGAITVGTLSTLALAGVRSAVTGIVTKIGVASTGAAIKNLSGAAAKNAAMAYLGGGALSAGGGGMAAGAARLSKLSKGVAIGVGLVATGLFSSYVGKSALRKAEEYNYKVEQVCSAIQAELDFYVQLIRCVNEQLNVLTELRKRVIERFLYFRPLLSDFDEDDVYQTEVFQTCGLLCKTIGEVARVSLLEREGQVSEDAKLIINKAKHLIDIERTNG